MIFTTTQSTKLLKICFFFFAICALENLTAATITSAQSGDWSLSDTWVGGVVPGVADDVIIIEEHNVVVTDTRSVNTVTVENASDIVLAILSVNAGGNLIITGNLTIASYTEAATARVDVSAAISVGGNIIYVSEIAADARIRMLNGGYFSLAGNITNTTNGNITSGAGVVSTFAFTGSSAQTIPMGTGYSYHNLVIDKPGSAVATINAAITTSKVRENIAISGGVFNNAGFAITGASGKNFTVGANGTYQLTSSTGLPATFTHNFETGSTVVFDGTHTVVNPNNGNYYHVSIQSVDTKSLGGNIAINGNLTIAGSTLDVTASNYSIDIKGNWSNNGGAFIERNGTVTFNGTVSQSISTDGNPFYNLVINNLVESGNAIVLQDDLNILHALTMTDGVISTSSNMVVLTDTDASLLSGFSDASFIIGFIRRHIATNGSTYSFPVGKASSYQRADFKNNNLSGVSYLTASFVNLERHNDGDMSVSDGDLVYTSISPTGMWTINADAEPVGGSYDILLFTGNMSGIIDNEFAPVKRASGASSAASWSTGGGTINDEYQNGRLVIDGYAVRRGLTSFSEFGMGLKQPADPLPIVLSSFTASLNANGKVNLDWVTQLEINNHFFTVDKSDDGTTFMPLTTVLGAGNSVSLLQYAAIDENPFDGVTYYRLKQTDFDGTFAYSDIVSVKKVHRLAENSINVYPQPVEMGNVLHVNNRFGAIQRIDIYEAATGRLVFSEKYDSSSGFVKVNHQLYTGIYVAQIFTGDTSEQVKILVR